MPAPPPPSLLRSLRLALRGAVAIFRVAFWLTCVTLEPVKAALTTLGCKANQADTAALAAILEGAGYQIGSWKERVDLYLINTCTVTALADQQSRQAIRQAHRRDPSAVLIVTGCYAQVDPSAIARIEGVDLVLGNLEKFQLAEHVASPAKEDPPKIAVGDLSRRGPLSALPFLVGSPRTRPLLKIQEGCNGACTFCIVPRARGPERSLPPEAVKGGLRDLLAAGCQEVVLTGIRLGAYGEDLTPRADLPGLLQDLLSLPGPWRLRLSSLEPQDLSPSLIASLKAHHRFCRHIHLPLQSGDDEILAWMGRPSTNAGYRRLIEALALNLPDIGLGADIVVGFPGETEEHFLRTYRFLEGSPLTYLHVFPFSPRPGTEASILPRAAPPPEKKERCRRLRALSHKKSLGFRQRFLGRRMEVIVLRKRERGGSRWWALSDNYLPLLIESGGPDLAGQLIEVEVERMEQDVLVGRPAKGSLLRRP